MAGMGLPSTDVNFLADATERRSLCTVGGGYRLIPRRLQDDCTERY
jgi:hypothetical protein